MRQTHYLKKTLKTGDVKRIPFAADDFQEMGVPASLMAGMPELEAFQLVNKRNKNQRQQRFVYILERA